MLMINLVACAAHPTTTALSSNSAAMGNSKKMDKFTDKSSGQLIKSPHGYVIDGPRKRFGGFLGDCSSLENGCDALSVVGLHENWTLALRFQVSGVRRENARAGLKPDTRHLKPETHSRIRFPHAR